MSAVALSMTNSMSMTNSAITGDHVSPARLPRRQATPTRPRLVLVPTGADAVARPAVRLRLTRTGRLAITVMIVLISLVAAVLMAAGVGSAAAPAPTVTVEAGQTLSSVAAAELPELPVDRAIAEFQVVNNLAGSQVRAGQELIVPQL
ncbi:LysM peptidoglycan-binding domain-containing protein [Janibacter sp. G56]|uniref:LysM peptidoglycan-binding domain-containing protein n=1 Tax=Janibacter sp. G56 TaxID=3418717 RepID=UPI003D018B3C